MFQIESLEIQSSRGAFVLQKQFYRLNNSVHVPASTSRTQAPVLAAGTCSSTSIRKVLTLNYAYASKTIPLHKQEESQMVLESIKYQKHKVIVLLMLDAVCNFRSVQH
jgi:hypothetical protein